MKNYSNPEIRRLVEEHEAIEAKSGTHSDFAIYNLCRLADLKIAMKKLSPPYREAIILVGKLQLSTRAAGRLIGASHVTMNTRYKRGLISLARYLNHAVQR